MAKSKLNKTISTPEETIAFLTGLFYIVSVNTNLHHYTFFGEVGHPSVPLLIITLALIIYSSYKVKRISTATVIIFTMLVTSSFVWFSGFYVNVLH